jgi:hypothetical protein
MEPLDVTNLCMPFEAHIDQQVQGLQDRSQTPRNDGHMELMPFADFKGTIRQVGSETVHDKADGAIPGQSACQPIDPLQLQALIPVSFWVESHFHST